MIVGLSLNRSRRRVELSTLDDLISWVEEGEPHHIEMLKLCSVLELTYLL